MNTISQGFFNQLPTLRTHLARVARIHENYLPIGAFCLIGCEFRELIPCCVAKTSVKFVSKYPGMVAHHVFNFELFKGDDLKHTDQIHGKLVSKILSFVRYSFVDARSLFALLYPIGTSSFRLAQSSLGFGELSFSRFKKSWIGNFFASRKHGKGSKTNINTNDFICNREGGSINFAREANVPFIVRPVKSHRLDSPRNVPVQFDSDVANILNVKLPVFQLNAVAIGRERDRIEAVSTFESGKSGSVSGFYTPKECVESFIKPSQNILRSRKIKFGNAFIKATNFFKRIGLIVVVYSFVPLFVAENPLLKGTIIQKAGRIKHIVKRGLLRIASEQSVFKSLFHFALSKYKSIALRISSATVNPVSIASFFNRSICGLVMYVSILFIHIIYTPHVILSSFISRKEGEI